MYSFKQAMYMNKKVILGIFSGLIISLAGVAQSPQNYKQQNLLVSKNKKEVKNQMIAMVHPEAFTTNSLQNHNNYKTFHVNPMPKTLDFDVTIGNRHRNYKQKNLLTKSMNPLFSKNESAI